MFNSSSICSSSVKRYNIFINAYSKILHFIFAVTITSYHRCAILALVPMNYNDHKQSALPMLSTAVTAAPISLPTFLSTNDAHSVLKSSCHCGQTSINVPVADLQYNSRVNDGKDTVQNNAAVDCYCRSCRRYHVAAFVSFVMAPTSGVTINGPIHTFRDICTEIGIVDRVHCSKCYTKLATRPRASAYYMDKTFINMGPLNDDSIPASLAKSWRQGRTSWQLDDQAPWINAMPKSNYEDEDYDENNDDDDDDNNQVAAFKQVPDTVGQQLRQQFLRGGCACGASRYRVDCTSPYMDEPGKGSYSTLR